MTKILRFTTVVLLFLSVFTASAQHQLGNSRISGDFGFNGMYYIPDSLIGAEKVDSKVRANAFLNLLYSNGGFSAGMRYEYYQFPLIDFEKIHYQGQGIKYFFADYKNDFIQVTAGNFYEQFGNGLSLRAYEDRQLGIDNSLLGARVKLNPYRGIYIKGIWGMERMNFESYLGRKDFVRGLDGEIALGELIPKAGELGILATVGASFVSKYEQSSDEINVTLYPGTDTSCAGRIPAAKIPSNTPIWAARAIFGYKGFRFDGEYAQKMQDPNVTNNYIYRKGSSLFLSATYSMKGFGVAASFISSDNMDFRSQRLQLPTTPLLSINNIPAINRQYSYQLISNYSFASQPNSQVGAQFQVNYQIPKKTKIGGKYGTDLTFNFSRFHKLKQTPTSDALEFGNMSGTEGYTTNLFSFDTTLLYQDIGFEISRRLTKKWKLILAYNFISYNVQELQKEEGFMRGHLVAADLSYKINNKHALRLELQHFYTDIRTELYNGSWLYGMLEYSISPHWFVSIGDQWNYGNENPDRKLHYFNIAGAYVWNTTRIALNFGKTQEGILCIGGVCRSVPASYGVGLSITTSF